MKCLANAKQFGITAEIIGPPDTVEKVETGDQTRGREPNEIQYGIIGARFLLLDFPNPSIQAD